MGTKGEIRGVMEKNEIEISDFSTGVREVMYLKEPQYGHGGGDYGIMHDFVKQVREKGVVEGLTSAGRSVQSHLMAFAAEKSRVEKKIITMKEFFEELKNNITSIEDRS